MGVPVPLGGRAFEIIAELVQAQGELVSKRDLTQRVWRGVFVEESALRVHIAAIRKALGPDRDMLATTVGRGYRLLGSWRIRHVDAPSHSAAPELSLSTNIPAATFDLIGRAAAIAHLWELLSAYRVVSLVGPGGIGKTALALQTARSPPRGFAADRLLIELASLSNPELVSSAVAAVLGIKLEGEDISAEAIARAIGDRQLLLVFDNCEHVIGAVARLTETIVSRCPGITIVATSREALRIGGEHVYRVQPLDVPPEALLAPDAISEHTSVELFMTRAEAQGSNFERDEENLGAVAAICRRLDGIPLAIEFAAARAAALGPPKIAALLDNRFKFLTTGRRTALPRQQTLRATLDWSYDLLPEAEARVLRRLGIFAGDFLLDAVIAVAGDCESGVVTDYLANLVAKSLAIADIRGERPYYRLLDTTRAYALEKLHASGEYPDAARRAAQYHRGLFANAEAESELKPQAEWLALYGRHIDNVRASLDWAFSPDGDAQAGVALTAAAVPLWVQLSLLAECRERTELALAMIDEGAAGAARLRMQLSAARAWSLMYGVGRAREAGPAWTLALQLAEQLGDTDYLLRALWGLCIDQFNNGEIRKALEFAHRFAEVAAGSSNSVDLMMADRLLATTLHYLGDQNLAHHHITRTLSRLSDLLPKPQVIRFRFDLRVSAHYFQARILWLMGLADQALRVVERNIEEGRASGHALTFCSVLGQGACPITFLAGDLDAAERYCVLLIEHTERHPIRLWNLWARAFRGMVMARSGGVATGLPVLRKALEVAGEARFLPRFLLPLGELASYLGEAGEVAQGLAAANDALARCEARDELWYQAELLRIKGELLLKAGEYRSVAAAEQSFDRSLQVARSQGAPFWELRTAISLARLRASQDRPAEAHHMLASVYAKFTEGFEISDLRSAKALMAQLSTD
ncbi:winged helix-turn-helix domain-containing protein [Bradyrhizobium sp. BRP22]|uniref:ATP-binding protein n=1 Tax=Bradyrhizobium sp. BRP22 TaxID=2793821 RepID=UPI001CD54D44|nr:winged helix-turn-helix domain-containing protein [Bradyrhizobium sp. BRP22]